MPVPIPNDSPEFPAYPPDEIINPEYPTLPGAPDDGIDMINKDLTNLTNDTTNTSKIDQITRDAINDWFKKYQDSISPRQHGGWVDHRGIYELAEKGGEWVVPTTTPEGPNFLQSTGIADQMRQIIREENNNINQPAGGGEDFIANFEIMIGNEKFGAAMVTAMKKDPEVRKTMKAMVR
jgi:hypothetical protein